MHLQLGPEVKCGDGTLAILGASLGESTSSGLDTDVDFILQIPHRGPYLKDFFPDELQRMFPLNFREIIGCGDGEGTVIYLFTLQVEGELRRPDRLLNAIKRKVRDALVSAHKLNMVDAAIHGF